MAILSPRSKSPRAGAGRTRKPSAAQKKTNENRADDAAKTRENKEKTQRAFARKAQRSNNDARAAALQDATNAAGAGESLSTEARIAALTDRLKSVTAQNKTLTLKNKKLKKLARPQAASTDKEIISILKPKGKFNLQEAMQLSDNRQLFTELQAGVHSIALEAKIDFDSSWSQQDPGTVAKVLRVAGERHPHLNAKRYPKNWATASMLQTYINSVRAYRSGKANPLSGVSRRRQRLTRVGRREAEATPRRRSSRQSPPPAGMDVDGLDNGDDVHIHGQDGSRTASPSIDKEVPRAPCAPRDDSDDSAAESDAQGYQDGQGDESSSEEDEELPVADD